MSIQTLEQPSTIVVRDPEDGSTVGEVAATTPAQLSRALETGFQAARGEHLPAHERARVLSEAAAGVEAAAEEHALLIATEGVKTIREARREVTRAVETLRLSAEEAKRVGGAVVCFDQARGGAGRTGWWSLRPAGLVAAVTPYNDPLNLVAHKLGPAFALGAPIIVKPHPQTPFSAAQLVQHFHDAGAPRSLVQIVFGGAALGEVLTGDERVRVVTFTGGRSAGSAIAARAGMKRLLMELGGVGVVAVAADADLARAASAIHSGAFWAAGQNCVHAQRVIAERSVAEELRERLCTLAGAMHLGPKRDELTDMGPLVNPSAAARVLKEIGRLRDTGARVLCGGTAAGSRLAPTWLECSALPPQFVHEEIFGPVATLETVDSDCHLLQRLADAGDSINVAIFTAALDTALAAYELANSAALIVNDSTDFRIDAMPFGGIGAAGLGREGVADAVAAMAEKKLLVINRAASMSPAAQRRRVS